MHFWLLMTLVLRIWFIQIYIRHKKGMSQGLVKSCGYAIAEGYKKNFMIFTDFLGFLVLQKIWVIPFNIEISILLKTEKKFNYWSSIIPKKEKLIHTRTKVTSCNTISMEWWGMLINSSRSKQEATHETIQPLITIPSYFGLKKVKLFPFLQNHSHTNYC